MYRYSVDNAVTYTPEDVVLFKESPFASFMERLTLENANHGIPPDVDSEPPRDTTQRQDEIAETLRSEDRNVSLIEWDVDEPTRRTATLEAMRHGVDFIVNGQLALGSLSGAANLLMRTSGYSELGNFLYIPCDTQGKTNLQSAFRLCFLADLLHSLQGQLPPQMLIIRGGSDVVPLQTEDHIYHYQAVKQRFMTAQREFRKHRMPDPAESSHFGRWADCANEVMKQRLLSGQDDAAVDSGLTDATADDALEAMPLSQAVGSVLEPAQGSIAAGAPAAGSPAAGSPAAGSPAAGAPATEQRYAKGIPVSDTLAAQARSLPSTTLPPLAEPPAVHSHHDSVTGAGSGVIEPATEGDLSATSAGDLASDRTTAKAADAALMDLQFIGSSSSAGQRDTDASLAPGGIDRRRARQEPPASSLGELHDSYAHVPVEPVAAESFPQAAVPDSEQAHPLDSPGFNVNQRSIVDRDELPPVASRVNPKTPEASGEEGRETPPPFSSSLITNDNFSADD